MFRAIVMTIPTSARPWLDAVSAEAAAVPRPERMRFVIGASIGLLRIATRAALVQLWTDRVVILAAIVGGLMIGVIDLASATRNPLRILIPLLSCAAGAANPKTAWRHGLLIGLGVPIAAALSPGGPYQHDRGDVWISIAPAVILATTAGIVSRRMARG